VAEVGGCGEECGCVVVVKRGRLEGFNGICQKELEAGIGTMTDTDVALISVNTVHGFRQSFRNALVSFNGRYT
jgi:hypothetical protein